MNRAPQSEKLLTENDILQNRSYADVTFLEMGTRLAEDGAYDSDIDLMLPVSPKRYCHRDGTPYPKQERRGP